MHVVIVDPSRVVLHKIAADLEVAGYHVDCFTDSGLALHHMKATATVDVVLTSLEVEPLPGLDLCWQLRTFVGDKRPLHIIVMSSNHSERALPEALDCGADDFVLKPVRHDELSARLRAANRIIALQRQLVDQANTDHLTGVLNRRAFLATMEARRQELEPSDSLALCLVDIDRLREVNDRYGHDAGDLVMQTVARLAAEEAPVVARIGGAGLALAFPVLGAEEAAHWCDVIRSTVAGYEFHVGEARFTTSCSFGVTTWGCDEPIHAALQRADRALSIAVSNGRNQVRIAPPNALTDAN
ncbi:MAG: diguanylate cyclase [Hyphomicrobium sp.]|uniref:GGDEF domain-containing response regulator n=1 Tax=Hyphomicrobium sp. TaxID=82 RepID=UPI003D0D133C